MPTLAGRTLFITGASRGIGLAIALRAARDGANVAILGKTDRSASEAPGDDPRSGRRRRGSRRACARDCLATFATSRRCRPPSTRPLARFGTLDILVNNASAISLTGTLDTPVKRFDLMMGVNVRGTFVASRACLPHLIDAAKAGRNPHILTLSPPLNLDPKWFKPHVAYTIAKYGMSLAVLGLAEEFRAHGVAVNALWPRTVIATAAVAMIPGAQSQTARMRKPEIVADAAHAILVATRAAAPATSSSTKTCCAKPASPTSDATRSCPGSR